MTNIFSSAKQKNPVPIQESTTAAAMPPEQVVQPSSSTRERAEGVKAYIEGKYAKQKNEEKEKKEAWDKLLT